MAGAKTIWVRHETKAKEQRVTVTPDGCKALLEAGFRVVVERSSTRVIPDDAYGAVAGVEMAAANAWRALSHDDNLLIVGLKELGAPEEHAELSLINKHAYFGHVFKGQEGWEKVLRQYRAGKTGVLYDYEYLWDRQGHNIGAAMSPFAGYVGCAQGIRAWCWQRLHPSEPLPAVVPSTKAAIVAELKAQLREVMIMGALGRCGRGAKECADSVGLRTIDWDMEETKAGGPFPAILDADIFVNCILLSGRTAPFLTSELIREHPQRKLSVISDVSCDPNSEYNPIPVYDHITSWEAPTLELEAAPRLQLISIDNLPSVLALEASLAFGDRLLPLLLDFPHNKCWAHSASIFRERLALLDREA